MKTNFIISIALASCLINSTLASSRGGDGGGGGGPKITKGQLKIIGGDGGGGVGPKMPINDTVIIGGDLGGGFIIDSRDLDLSNSETIELTKHIISKGIISKILIESEESLMEVHESELDRFIERDEPIKSAILLK